MRDSGISPNHIAIRPKPSGSRMVARKAHSLKGLGDSSPRSQAKTRPPPRCQNDLPVKITFGEMRASDVRDVLIYCRDYRCGHHVESNADGWPDDVRLSDIEPRFTCTRCGQRGADVRPKLEQARMGSAG